MATEDPIRLSYSRKSGRLRPEPERRVHVHSRKGTAATADDRASALIRVFLSSSERAEGVVPAASQELVEELRDSLDVAHRLREVGDRIGTGTEDLLTALTALARRTPAEAGEPATSLSEQEERVLREAGSLLEPMPILERRASAATTVAALDLLADALTVKQAAGRLGVTDGRVRQRLSARTLLGVDSTGGWKLPAFQFTEDGELRGLDQVLPALPDDVHPLVVRYFLTTPSTELPVNDQTMSPRAWLLSGGDVARVVALAEDLHAMP